MFKLFLIILLFPTPALAQKATVTVGITVTSDMTSPEICQLIDGVYRC